VRIPDKDRDEVNVKAEEVGTDEKWPQESESAFAWELRAMAVALFWTLPGMMLGVLIRLVIPDGGPTAWWIAVGGVLGAIVGGLLEADS
jgi:hypothetical protein